MLQRGYRTTASKARWVLLAGLLASGAPAVGGPVSDWHAFSSGLVGGRGLAMTQIAVHDALNSIDPLYETYTDVPRAAAGASPDAAVAAASRVVLLGVAPPAQAAAITTYYNAQMSGCLSQACLDGIAAGEAAANAILLRRIGDGFATPHLPYTLAPGPGVYQPTPPTPPAVAPNPPVQNAGLARALPFALRSGSQFRADPSPMFDLTSAEYTRDYNEVKRVGALNAEALGNRTPDQSAVARFWPGGGANWNAVMRVIVADRGLDDDWQLARLFALNNMAQTDAAIAVFDTKFTYNFWRPVTAIRYTGDDGNPATTPDPTWLSYQNTPPYPDYTCGLTTNAGASTEVLRRYFGTDDIGYTLTTPAGITRTFTSLSQASAEAVDARVFGGMHFRTGCVQGVRHGEQVGRFVFQHELRPAKK